MRVKALLIGLGILFPRSAPAKPPKKTAREFTMTPIGMVGSFLQLKFCLGFFFDSIIVFPAQGLKLKITDQFFWESWKDIWQEP